MEYRKTLNQPMKDDGQFFSTDLCEGADGSGEYLVITRTMGRDEQVDVGKAESARRMLLAEREAILLVKTCDFPVRVVCKERSARCHVCCKTLGEDAARLFTQTVSRVVTGPVSSRV